MITGIVFRQNTERIFPATQSGGNSSHRLRPPQTARRTQGFGLWSIDQLDIQKLQPARPLEAHFHAIIESSDDAIISKDLTGIVTSWNPGAAAIFGYSAEEMIGQPMLKLFPAERVSEEADILQKIIAGQKVDHFETVRVRKDGRQINISATISPIRDVHGIIVGASKVARDISDKHRYEAIFALSPDGFLTFDRHLQLTHASHAIETLTRLPAAALIGQSLSTFVNLLNQGNLQDSQVSGPESLLDLSCHRRSINLNRQALDESQPKVLNLQARSAEEGLISLVVCLRDVSHESHVERLKSEFMATAAHELRTPMTSIQGFVELLILREASIKSAERKHLLDIIHKQSLLMNAIIDDLLDLNKLESRSSSDLKMTTLDASALVRDVIAAWPLAPDRSPPTLLVGDAPLKIYGDATYLRRAILNLLSNAFKYSNGQAQISISVGVDPDDPTQLRLSISDEGRGMTPEQLTRYGERFYRADDSGSVPGTGLGVSIVKQIVELHGGWFGVESAFNKGTCVTVKLPLLAMSN